MSKFNVRWKEELSNVMYAVVILQI